MRCAHIVDGIVINVVLADPAFSYGDGSLIVASETAQIGDACAGGVFTPAAPAAPIYPTTGLTFLQFMALFTAAEQAAIVQSTDAQIRLFTLMAAGAAQIDLANPDVTAGVGYLATKGVVTAPRAAAILSGAPPA